jgi:hypothetical protein
MERISSFFLMGYAQIYHLSRPDSFVKLFETLCLCLAQGNECLGQI